jgi:hypothetical protein
MNLSPDGQETIYATSLAGASAQKLVLDRQGNAYVTGNASAAFKATAGAYKTSGGNAFVTKIDASGAVQYATYLDFLGSGGIAVDSFGQVWAVGTTCPSSVPGGFSGPICMSGGGPVAGTSYGTASAVRKLDSQGAKLLVTKTFGGGRLNRFQQQYDAALDVAVNSADSVWVVGVAESDGVPPTPGAINTQPPFGYDGGGGLGFAVKFSSAGDLIYGTYLSAGGSNRGSDMRIPSIALDSQGRPYFPLGPALVGPALAGGALRCSRTYGSVTALSTDGSNVLFTTISRSPLQHIALDGNGGLYAAGNTTDEVFVTTPGVYQQLYPGGALAGYVARFEPDAAGSFRPALLCRKCREPRAR